MITRAFMYMLLVGAGQPGESRQLESPAGGVVNLDQSRTFRLRIGIRVNAADGPVQRAVAAVAVPIDWPEQQVRVLDTEHPTGTQVQNRRAGDTAEQMLLRLPRLGGGSTATVVRRFEVTRWTQRVKAELLPQIRPAPPVKVRAYLQPSDGIESSHAEIRRFASESIGDRTDPLTQARALFDATREHVHYVEGPFAGALAALRSGEGDCEERSCLFIALCRAAGIPARLVWGPGHCWSEIALSTTDGKLVWIPADPTKEPTIGVINHFSPILQKGDRFYVPEFPDRQLRYLAPYCAGLGPKPEIELIEEEDPIEAEAPAGAWKNTQPRIFGEEPTSDAR
jgi:hypothetical protein